MNDKKLSIYLEGILEKVMLDSSDKQELINAIDMTICGKLLKKINNLNGALEERNINYRIIEFSISKMIDGKEKRYPSAWKVMKLTNSIT